MKGRKRAIRISNLVDRVTEIFLPDKAKIGYTTDNGGNMISALEDRDHVRCVNHYMALIV